LTGQPYVFRRHTSILLLFGENITPLTKVNAG
jgi:hypothetical protein